LVTTLVIITLSPPDFQVIRSGEIPALRPESRGNVRTGEDESRVPLMGDDVDGDGWIITRRRSRGDLRLGAGAYDHYDRRQQDKSRKSHRNRIV
jgi:hypothetical protein